MKIVNDGYGWAAESPANLKRVIKSSVKQIGALKKGLGFQALAFTGMSGAAIAFPAGVEHSIPLICVRKDTDDHHGSPIECNSGKTNKL